MNEEADLSLGHCAGHLMNNFIDRHDAGVNAKYTSPFFWHETLALPAKS